MNSSLENVYREHHHGKRRGGFASLEKERGELFKKLVGKGKKVLDIGCRDGVLTKYFIEGNDVTGTDIDSVVLEEAARSLGIKTVHFDLQEDQWPIEPNSFDAVVAGELLEHVYFPEKVIEKVHTVLKSGGVFVGSVPNAFSLINRVRLFMGKKAGTPLKDPMHINHFKLSELEAIFKRHFSQVEFFGLGNKHFGLRDYSPNFFSYSLAFRTSKKS
jgi:2-polyprenyl-3-methyl-5-hydroxy-6-metoxy-1,4-benzoquinol methylase